MTLSVAGYVINDALIKLTTETVPLFQSIFLRGVVVVVIFLAAAQRMDLLGDIRRYINRPLFLRVSMETIGTVLYLNALTNAPLAGLTAVLQIVPVAVTFLAARLLREKVSWHRVASVIVGFIGVLVIIRPGSSDFNPWFLVGLIVVVAIVIRELATTHIPVETPSVIVSLTTAVAITTMGGFGSVFQGWSDVSGTNTVRLIGAACFIAIGYLASVITVRVGDLSFSAPFRYTIMLFAIVLQIVVFNDVPDVLTFVGTALIIAAGLYAFRKETRAVRLSPPPSKLRF
jgi:drug/metabolite transporter (DMT)-like permease